MVEALDPKKIRAYMQQRLAIGLDVFESIDSTNAYLKQFNGKQAGLRVCIAEMQTQGRGQFDRSWYSPFGQNIYLSMRYPFQKEITHLKGLSLVVGLSVCRVIESVCSLKPNCLKVKWPNDVFWDACKLAGILIEIQKTSKEGCQAIIGIGVNVNMQKTSQISIEKPWASLFEITKTYQDRNRLSAALIDTLMDDLDLFSNEGLTAFMKAWKQRDYLKGRFVTLQLGQQKQEGVCQGVDDQGCLLIQAKDGKVSAWASGGVEWKD